MVKALTDGCSCTADVDTDGHLML